jgi:hypothetical protein
MRSVYAFGLAAALAGSALLSTGANAAEVCDKSCVGPACKTDCVREPDTIVGRDRDVTIERRREPGVEVREHRGVEVERTRPGVGVEVGR